MIRALSWNILQGGGRRTDEIVSYFEGVRADIIVLQEFRDGPNGDQIRAALKGLGLTHQFMAEADKTGGNTLFVAARFAFDAGDFMADRTGPCHIIEAAFLEMPLVLLNIHFPQKAAQKPLFSQLDQDTPSLLEAPVLMLGDMNCGIPFEDSDTKTFQNTGRFQALLEAGWVDLWRRDNPEAKAFSWISPRTGNGFRYDHAFASSKLDVMSVDYDHTVREGGLSDHSALMVSFKAP